MAFSIRVNEKESELIKNYAKINGKTVSEVLRDAILEKIEDEFDSFIYDEALKGYEENPNSYSLEEAKKLLDF